MTDTEALKALVARRIPAALKRITDGHGLMRVPAEDTDPDLVLADCKIALERMLASQTQDMVLVPRDPTAEMLLAWQNSDGLIKAYHAMLSAAPVASQMGEPFGWLRANGHFERGAELISKHPQDAGGAIPLYAAPAAGMDADSSPPLAESVGDVEGAAQLMTWLRDEVLSGHWNSHGGPWGCIPCDAYQKVDLFLRKHVGREGVKSHGDKK